MTNLNPSKCVSCEAKITHRTRRRRTAEIQFGPCGNMGRELQALDNCNTPSLTETAILHRCPKCQKLQTVFVVAFN